MNKYKFGDKIKIEDENVFEAIKINGEEVKAMSLALKEFALKYKKAHDALWEGILEAFPDLRNLNRRLHIDLEGKQIVILNLENLEGKEEI